MDEIERDWHTNLPLLWPFIVAILALLLLFSCGCSGDSAARVVNPDSALRNGFK